MATTDQPQEPVPGQVPPAQSTPTAQTLPMPPFPGYPTYAAAPVNPAPVAQAAPTSNSHVGVIVASIVGGILLLCLTFGGGAVIGWTLGSHFGTRVAAQENSFPGPGARGWGQGGQERGQQGPGHHGRKDKSESNGSRDQEPTPSPAPTPTPTP